MIYPFTSTIKFTWWLPPSWASLIISPWVSEEGNSRFLYLLPFHHLDQKYDNHTMIAEWYRHILLPLSPIFQCFKNRTEYRTSKTSSFCHVSTALNHSNWYETVVEPLKYPNRRQCRFMVQPSCSVRFSKIVIFTLLLF